MKKLVYFSILIVLVLGSFSAALAQAPEKPAPVLPDKISLAAPSRGIQSLSGSYNTFDPAVGGEVCYTPGAAQTFCFEAHTFTNDYEYVYTDWLQFPGDWTVTNAYVVGTPTCTGGGTWGTFGWAPLAPNHIQINHTRYQLTVDDCVAFYCVDVVSGTGSPDALVDWGYDGDGYGNPPHWPCSIGGYNPPGYTCDERIFPAAAIPPCVLPPIMLLPAELDAQGCPWVEQQHTLTVLNNTGYDTTVTLAYAVAGGLGTCTGPASIGVPNGASAPIVVSLLPMGHAGDVVQCEVTATDAANPGNTDQSEINKTLTGGGWAAAWALESNAGAIPQQWGSGAATGGKAYYVAGLDNVGGVHAAFQEYDPATDTWTQLPAYPWAHFGSVAGWIGGKLYVAGGSDAFFTGATALYVWDGVSWTPGPAMPVARLGGGGGAAPCVGGGGDCLYVAGGTPDGYFTSFSFTLYEYNPATGVWTQRASVPGDPANGGQALGGGTVCDGKVYFGGDYRGIADFFGYDPGTDAWTQLAAIPAGAGKMTPAMACGPDGNIYLIGGDSLGLWGDTANNRVYEYDVAANTWTQMAQSINQGLLGSFAEYAGNQLFTFGGTTGTYAISPAPHESLLREECPPPPNTMHVASVQLLKQGVGPWLLTARGQIHNTVHVPLPGTLVQAQWLLPNGTKIYRQFTTNVQGGYQFNLNTPTPGQYRFCVVGLIKVGYSYVKADNHMAPNPPCRLVTLDLP